MKVRGVLALMIALTVIASGASASGEVERKGGKISVACAPSDFSRLQFKTKPKHCIFLKRGGSGFSFEIVGTKSLKWKHWGRPHAHAKGVALFNMGSRPRVKVLLSEPKSICGHRLYSKVTFKFEGGKTSDEKLDTCPRYL